APRVRAAGRRLLHRPARVDPQRRCVGDTTRLGVIERVSAHDAAGVSLGHAVLPSVARAARLWQSVERRKVRSVELELGRCEVLLEALELSRAGDGDDGRALGERPRQGDLGGRATVLLRYGAHGLDEREVRLQRGLVAEARVRTTPVAFLEVRKLRETAGEEAATER